MHTEAAKVSLRSGRTHTVEGRPRNTQFMVEPMRALWARLGPMPQSLRLYGGTALALYLNHRRSTGFDFATSNGLIDADLVKTIDTFSNSTIVGGEVGMVDLIVLAGGEIQVTLMECGVYIPRPALPPRLASNGVAVADPVDLVAAKFVACTQRDVARDFEDLAAAEEHWPGILASGLDIALRSTSYQRSSLVANLADPPPLATHDLDERTRIVLARHALALNAGTHGQEERRPVDTPQALGYDPKPDMRHWHGTPIPPVDDPIAATPERCAIAERMWWNGPPWTVLRNSARFICHAIDHARDEDHDFLRQDLELERWTRALRTATPGTMSRSRYVLWSRTLGLMPVESSCDWTRKGHRNDFRLNDSREQAYERHAKQRRWAADIHQQ